MAISRYQLSRARPSLSFVLLAGLLIVLWIAGGASREDAAGQVVSRIAAWVSILISIVFSRRPRVEEASSAALFLLGAILICAAQLVPLPPGVWRALPGRVAFADPLVSPAGLWRPWSLVPGATINALLSLVVPLAVLVLATSMREEQKRWLPALILAVIALSLLVGLFQFTGVPIINPLVNGTPGSVDGLIANRNHYALFLSFGVLIAPTWALGDGTRLQIRTPAALGLVVLLVMAILATGSRAGMVLGVVAFALGLMLSWRGVKTALRRYPPWMLPALIVGLVALLAIFVLASFGADRALSIDRLVGQDPLQDMRGHALPVVLAIIRNYFPLGTGMGSFDPVFRMHEPLFLLQPTYFNHAHNEYLEIVLDGGMPGLVLLLAALGWWGWRSIAAWRAGPSHTPARLGSALLLLILIASLTDYPARTPIVMAIAMVAAIWLDRIPGSRADGKAALPAAR